MTKKNKIISLLLALVLVMLACALPIGAAASYEMPPAEELTEKLDLFSKEGIVWDTSFVRNDTAEPSGTVYNHTHFEGTVNADIFVPNNSNAFSASDAQIANQYNKNLYAEDGSVVFKSYIERPADATLNSGDNNNAILVNIHNNNTPAKSFVVSVDLTVKVEQMRYNIKFDAKTRNPALSSEFLTITQDRTVKAGSNVLGKLEVDKSTNFTVHVKFDVSDGANITMLYDVYIDGVLMAENLTFVSGDLTSTTSVDYMYIANTYGSNVPVYSDASISTAGVALYSVDAFRMYYSEECYEPITSVKDAKLSRTDEGYKMTYKLALDDTFVSDAGAKLRFTAPSSETIELDVSSLSSEDGIYTAEFSFADSDVQDILKLELISSEGEVYNMYNKGRALLSDERSYSVLKGELAASLVTIMPVYGGKKGIVTLTFDDAIYPTALVVNELCEKYGLTASMMMKVNNINDSGYAEFANAQTWAELFAKGYLEPQNHSMKHLHLDTWSEEGQANQSEANYKQEIYDSKLLLEELFPNYDFITYAMPYGSMSDAAANYAMQYYYAMRGTTSSMQSLDPAVGITSGTWGRLNSPSVVKKDEGGNVVSDEEQLVFLKGWVDKVVSSGGWYMPIIHRIGDVDSTEMSYAVSDAFFAYIASYQNSGDIWVASFSDATKYIRERQNTTASVRYDGASAFVTLTMAQYTEDGLPLSADIFNHPLTVKVELMDTLSTVFYKLGDECKSAQTFIENGITYAYIDIIPNGEEIEISASHKSVSCEKLDNDTHTVKCDCGYTEIENHEKNEYGFCRKCEISLSGVSLLIHSDLALRYYVNVYDKANISADSLSMSFTMNGKTYTVNEYSEEGGAYVFTFAGIGPHLVGADVDAVLTVNGTTVNANNGFSIEDYCLRTLELNEENTELTELINDLLIYARAAEKYHLDTETIADGVTLTPTKYAPGIADDAMEIIGSGDEKLYVCAAGVKFYSTNSIYFKIYSQTDDFTVTITNADGTSVTYSASELSKSGSCYIVYTEPVSSSLFGIEGLCSVALKNSEGVEVESVSYTVNTYVYYILQDADASDNMKTLAAALYRYGKSCRAYNLENCSPLWGKEIINFGDSIFGMNKTETGVSNQLQLNTGATVYNCAFSGTRAYPKTLPK